MKDFSYIISRTLVLVLLLLGSLLRGQNLIVNPGLEEVDPAYTIESGRLDTFDLHNIRGWYNPTPFGTPDYFNSDGKHQHCGSCFWLTKDVKARTGNGYTGIYIDKTEWREFVGVALTEPLRRGQNYQFSMWLRINPESRYALNLLQLRFVDTSYALKGSGYGHYFPPIEIYRTNQIAMTSGWTKVTVDFTAFGGEASVQIGILQPTFTTTALPPTPRNQGNEPYCYYYMDDLELIGVPGAPIPRKTDVRPVIFFDTDKDVVKKEFYLPLDSVVAKLKENASMTVKIYGYTDSVGNVEENLALSLRRAEAVKKYLVTHGIAASRITTVGCAESRPAGASNAENRRVEFIFKP